MNRNTRIFIILAAFYVIVALIGLLIWGSRGRGSAFSVNFREPAGEAAVMSQTVIGTPSEPVAIEEETETEPQTEPEDTAAETAEAEPAAEETETASEPEIRYFTFITNTTHTILRLRQEPSEEAVILKKLQMRTPGYITKPGNEWCRVVMDTGATGYCATEYLSITEVTEDTYPVQFHDMVEAPDEELTAAQFTTELKVGTASEESADGTAEETAGAATDTDVQTDAASGTENITQPAADASDSSIESTYATQSQTETVAQ